MHRRALSFLLLTALGVPAWGGGSTEEAGPDLQLHLIYDGPEEIDPWDDVSAQLCIENTSATLARPIVLPGDGSWAGWREPTMGFEWEALDDPAKGWAPIPCGVSARCGNYDPEWRDEVVVIEPGDSVALSGWLMPTRFCARLSGHRRVRVRALYAYDARSPDDDPRRGAALPGESPTHDTSMDLPRGDMGDTAAFRLESEWIELVVRPPLTLTCTQVTPLPREGEINPREHFEVTLTNPTGRPFALFVPRDESIPYDRERVMWLQFQIDVEGRVSLCYASYSALPAVRSKPLVLEPGESVDLSLFEPGGVRGEKPTIAFAPDQIERMKREPCRYTIVVSRSDWAGGEALMARGPLRWVDSAP